MSFIKSLSCLSDRDLWFVYVMEVALLPKNLPLVGLRLPLPDVGVIDLYDWDPLLKLPVLFWCYLTKPGGARGRPRADMADD